MATDEPYIAVDNCPKAKVRLASWAQQMASRPNPPTLAFSCHQKWDDLQRTQSALVRYCTECQKEVFGCETPEDEAEHQREGNCIARLYAPVAEIGEP